MSITRPIAGRRLLLGGAVAALVLGAAAAPAAASPAVFPVGGTDQQEVGGAESLLTGARSAFEALPDRDEVPIAQIMRNMGSGYMW